ncbi:transcriptional regulator [Halobacillus kuroshimensis]|uniref:HTH-type transcriptional regulator n=1 Tax=Halobacillus kuroshimensis TaxID=302481 RepID=A0ABS3DQP5_9BACI|nr:MULTISPECIES: helix-turn-helix domain-containing protein [Halobacillus]MBN8233640.1 transcriptional regulator [Halobacillus kuroshimensis]
MGGNDHHNLEDIHTKVIHEFSKTLEMFGLSMADSRLFVTLYLHPSPMTLDEMSSELGKSKTAMSTGIRNLSDQGLVERVWKKGVRKDLYTSTTNLYKTFMTSYIQKWQTAVNEQENELAAVDEQVKVNVQNCVKQEEMDEAEFLQERMREMIHFHTCLSKALQSLHPDPF